MKIERTTERGYEVKEETISNALSILNKDLEEERQIWINNRPFMKKMILAEDLSETDKISITNKLVGG